ncbi:hypothetical protein CVD28_20290 [Bacillus sp. M6-12]|uniref:YidH family protein n=1 Tax=Bacillus sp. M6-12 TaxID=2054166 RepID=UPI000C765D12|nr:DUF202 domain-containing protein [Bacillus sp. M6-12]PLS15845.1 hypothetical protein CVD28_20290 [Bacillus sp. M6-12]
MEGMDLTTKDSKYIQQHLANERTYLAWVRTCIAIIGIGFLIINLHFNTMASGVAASDTLAKVIGLSSIVVGIIGLILTTVNYFRKGKEINEQTFVFSKMVILTLSILITLIFLTFGVYYLVLLRML